MEVTACCNVTSLIQRRNWTDADKKKFRDVSPSSRAAFMKDSQNLFGSDLDKKMHEITTQSRMRKQSFSFTADGKLQDIDGEEGIKQRWQTHPISWKHCWQTAVASLAPSQMLRKPGYRATI